APVTFQTYQAVGVGTPGGSTLGFGDVRLTPRMQLLGPIAGFQLAAALPLVIPTGAGGDFGGSGGFGVQPRVILSYGKPEGVRVLANVGFNLREAQQLENVIVGNEFAWALAAALPFRIGETQLAATANLYGVVGLHPGGS